MMGALWYRFSRSKHLRYNSSRMTREWSFKDEISVLQIDLARASLYLAKQIAYPQLRIADCLDQVETLANEAAVQFSRTAPREQRATLLSEYLFQQRGFRGNREAYYDVRNSFLSDVLTRKVGIPISLSVLFIAVARHLKIPTFGIGMPGHFIVMVPDGDKRLFFDPFHGGGRLSINDCSNLVQQTTGYSGPFDPRWLDPVSEKQILSRMLVNLRGSYVQFEQWPEAIRVLRCLQLLHPRDATIMRDLGVLYFQQGNLHTAVHLLERYAQQEPDASDLTNIKNGIAQKFGEWVRKN